MIPYGRQTIDEDDLASVLKVLESDWLTQGPTVQNFEEKVSEYSDARYAVATNSATSALHVACKALELGAGDILWTSPNTFVASANCALYCGAKVDFVDICPVTFNMCSKALSEKLIQAKKLGKLPKIVIPVHFGGQPCDMEAIKRLSIEYKFKIIEDASHALGARYKGQAVGAGNYSDITVFSFHPVKMITTGEGGMALTSSKTLRDKMLRDRTHGVVRDPKLFTKFNEDEIWGFQQQDLGFNYRMSDIHAALGISQLKKLDQFIHRRTQIADIYNQAFKGSFVVPQEITKDVISSYHLYVVRLKLDNSSKNQQQVYTGLREQGVGVNLHYIPVYRHPYYRRLGFPERYCNEAESYFRETLSLPIYPNLTLKQQEKIIEILLGII